MAEWSIIVDGVRLNWEQVVFKISTGAWSLSEAMKYTLFSKEALIMRLEMSKAAGGAVARAAGSALVRIGAVEAGVAAGGAAAGLTWLGWAGIIGAIVLVGAGGYWIYTKSKTPTDPSSAPTSATSETVATAAPTSPSVPMPPTTPPDQPCPPLAKHRTKCPWTPDGFAVEECSEGFCWDGGPQGALACKQAVGPPNSGRTDTNNIRCPDGTGPVADRCTGVITACQ